MMVIYGDKEASRYLREKHGISHAPSTLRKKRVVGGGPKFLSFNRRFSGYPQEKLDQWARERTEIVATTSEVGYGSAPEQPEMTMK
jgi:hypothetical protein